MTEAEALQLIGQANLLDARCRIDADRAVMWAGVLADVSLEDALWAMREHYRTSTDSMLPAHLLTLLRARRREEADRRYHERLELEQREATAKAAPMPPEVRAELERLRKAPVKVTTPLRPKRDPEGLAAARAELDALRAANPGGAAPTTSVY